MRSAPVAGLVAAVVVAALGTGLAVSRAGTPLHDTSAGRTSIAPSPSASPVVDPVPTSECSVPGAASDIALTPAQAEDLTTRAATLNRHWRPAEALVGQVATALDASPQDARAVARSLMGLRVADGLNCSYLRTDVAPEKMGRGGLTPRAQRVRRAWTEVFGAIPAGGFASGGVSTGHVDNSAHYEGRAMDVFFRPLDSQAQRRAGWVFAQWVVAHAERYHVLSVIYSDHIWTSWASFLGWRDYQHPGGPTRNPVLRHLDHVHVAVESGRTYRPG